VHRVAVLGLQQYRISIAEAIGRVAAQIVAAAERRHHEDRHLLPLRGIRQPRARAESDRSPLAERRQQLIGGEGRPLERLIGAGGVVIVVKRGVEHVSGPAVVGRQPRVVGDLGKGVQVGR